MCSFLNRLFALIIAEWQCAFATIYINNVTTPTILRAGDKILSKSGDTLLHMQIAGNCLLKLDTHRNNTWDKVLWMTGTGGLPQDSAYFEISSDGNLMFKNVSYIHWQSNTGNHFATPPHTLFVEEECVYLMNKNMNRLWNEGNCPFSRSPVQYIHNITVPMNGVFKIFRQTQIYSPSRSTNAVMQASDGNWVLYENGIAKWASNTHNVGADFVEVRSTGNIIIKQLNGDIFWESNTFAPRDAQPLHLVVSEGCVHLIDKYLNVVWSPCTICGATYPTGLSTPAPVPIHRNYVTTLTTGNDTFKLFKLDAIWSISMNTHLTLEQWGNVVLYFNAHETCRPLAIWSTNMSDAQYIEINNDGNIMAKDNDGTVYWQSHTSGNIATQPHRLFVITACTYLVDSESNVLWFVGTGCHNVSTLSPISGTNLPSSSPITDAPSQDPTEELTINTTIEISNSSPTEAPVTTMPTLLRTSGTNSPSSSPITEAPSQDSTEEYTINPSIKISNSMNHSPSTEATFLPTNTQSTHPIPIRETSTTEDIFTKIKNTKDPTKVLLIVLEIVLSICILSAVCSGIYMHCKRKTTSVSFQIEKVARNKGHGALDAAPKQYPVIPVEEESKGEEDIRYTIEGRHSISSHLELEGIGANSKKMSGPIPLHQTEDREFLGEKQSAHHVIKDEVAGDC